MYTKSYYLLRVTKISWIEARPFLYTRFHVKHLVRQQQSHLFPSTFVVDFETPSIKPQVIVHD